MPPGYRYSGYWYPIPKGVSRYQPAVLVSGLVSDTGIDKAKLSTEVKKHVLLPNAASPALAKALRPWPCCGALQLVLPAAVSFSAGAAATCCGSTTRAPLQLVAFTSAVLVSAAVVHALPINRPTRLELDEVATWDEARTCAWQTISCHQLSSS